ncbi:MAG: DUF2341 domain-containing protein [Bacteroidetes bacterium]|nr:DUF2341 domain-containing protein [Bacteroidota bacterium]MBV6461442.1 hypothetical protein [Flavobacteriales bacterium]WKZ76561.1 MAG: DUF2341 domain-containing protein [Vicingaceae bacterium]MCL4815619.1 DUF2341 domain-containing protein [Flavobacteriales bacterium]NOG94243.1 DUF2341 domain-containing protein [Bacteroidota bacterium]
MKKIVLFNIIALLANSMLFSQLNGWEFKVPVKIYEKSGVSLSQFQVPIYFDTQTPIQAGDMKPMGEDIRFSSDCDGSNLLLHYIDSGINSPNTKIWVRVPSIPANDSVTIFIFYGNPLAPQTSNINTFDGQHSATDSVVVASINSIVSNSQRGFRFTVNQKMLVGALGKREPTGTARIITIFDFNSQAKLAQDTVPIGVVGQYNYKILNQPIWLNAGQQYILSQFQALNDGYYYGTSSQSGQHLTYNDMRFCNSCNQNTFPTSSLGNMHYGTPDFWYYLYKTASVAPSYVLGNISPTTPVVTVLSNDTLCEGDTAFLESNFVNGATYQWLFNSNLINGAVSQQYGATSSGNYAVVITDQLGCKDTSASVSILVNSLPNATITPIGSICSNAPPVTLNTATPGGIWSGNGITNVNTGEFDPSVAGVGTHIISYSVTDNTTGCTGEDTLSIVILDCTGINENGLKADVSIYPNPSNGNFTISIQSEIEQNLQIQILNNNGQKVNTFDRKIISGQNKIEINLANFSKGNYLINILNGIGVKSYTIVLR